jgi:heptosyltransferase-2
VVSDAVRGETLAALGLQRPEAPLLAIAPGAEYGPAKRWPARHFAAVAAAKRAQGWQVWLFGSKADTEAAAQIPADQNLAGRTTLDQAVALLSLADAVVSNDSGLMHVAAALGRPQVAVFGPSDPLRTGPHNAKAHVLRLGVDCSPCNKRVCPLGHHRCLEDLEPAQVLDRLPPRGQASA